MNIFIIEHFKAVNQAGQCQVSAFGGAANKVTQNKNKLQNSIDK